MGLNPIWMSTVVVLLASLLGTTGLSESRPDEPTVALQSSGGAVVGQPVPWFSGWTADEQVVNTKKMLASPKAKAVVLVFFATWCKNCKIGLKALAQESQRLSDAGLSLLLVAYEQDRATVAPWLEQLGHAKSGVLIDRYGEIAKTFGVVTRDDKSGEEKATLPLTIVFDRIGTVRGIFAQEGGDYVLRIVDTIRQY